MKKASDLCIDGSVCDQTTRLWLRSSITDKYEIQDSYDDGAQIRDWLQFDLIIIEDFENQ